MSSTDFTCRVRMSSARCRTGQNATSSRFDGRFTAGAALIRNGSLRAIRLDARRQRAEVERRRHVERDVHLAHVLVAREALIGAGDHRLDVGVRQVDALQPQRVLHHRGVTRCVPWSCMRAQTMPGTSVEPRPIPAK